MTQRVAVIGCGNMGSAIVQGLLRAGWVEPEHVVASNPDPEKAQRTSEMLGIRCITDNVEATRGADIVILGVKPQIIKPALKQLRDHLRPNQLVISIAAGISTRFIEYYTRDVPVVRAMPNLATTVGMGMTAICPGAKATEDHMAITRVIFEAVGLVEGVAEYQMDAVTGLSGTGPMYVFHLIEAMADAGVLVGLSRETATRMAMQTVRGSARLAQTCGLHPAELKDQVSSPGGTSIHALHVLRKNAFSAIVMDAVQVATRRSSELGE